MRILQQMRTDLVEGDAGIVPHVEHLLVDGAVVGDLHQRIAHADMVVLVAAHKAS